MKYVPRDQIKTSCKNCVFAIYKDDTQTGCLANRLQKFDDSAIEAYDNEKEFYILKQFCNLYRPQSWNANKPDINLALKESSLSFDIVIHCDSVDALDTQKFLDQIYSNDYYREKIQLCLCHDQAASSRVRSSVLEIHMANRNILISIHKDKNTFLHESIMKSKKSCFVSVDITNFDIKCLSILNDYINISLKKCALAHVLNAEIVSCSAYKTHNLYDGTRDYSQNINSLLELSQQKNMYLKI